MKKYDANMNMYNAVKRWVKRCNAKTNNTDLIILRQMPRRNVRIRCETRLYVMYILRTWFTDMIDLTLHQGEKHCPKSVVDRGDARTRPSTSRDDVCCWDDRETVGTTPAAYRWPWLSGCSRGTYIEHSAVIFERFRRRHTGINCTHHAKLTSKWSLFNLFIAC